MEIFKIVNNENEINLSKSWVDSPKFDNKDTIVNHSGREYRLIAKKERSFSCPERIGRGFLGVMAVCCSLGLALLSKTIKDLFTKNKETIYFGMIHNPAHNAQTDKKIQSLIIGDFCMESYPCQHDCTVTYSDGQQATVRLNGVQLKKLIAELPEENLTNPCRDNHFSSQEYPDFRKMFGVQPEENPNFRVCCG